MNASVPFTDLGAMAADVWTAIKDEFEADILSARFVGGPRIDEFEARWAEYCGIEHAIGVANGTDAIALALRAAGIGPGDEVVVPSSTFIATAEAVVMAGASPVFADVDPGTLLLTAETLTEVLTPATRAVIVVHLYGQMPDMDALSAVVEANGLVLVEDAAQAHGASWNGRRPGSWGRAATFSFYPGKNLGAFGDAGAVVTRDAELAERVRSLANHGRALGTHYEHDLVGINSRLDSLQALALTAKLERLDDWTESRRALMRHYQERLQGTGIRLLDTHPLAHHVYHLAVVRVPQRAAVQQHLRDAGIATGVHYPVPCHLQPAFAGLTSRALPHAERGAQEVLSLPLYPSMTIEQVDLVCDALQKAVENLAPHDFEGGLS